MVTASFLKTLKYLARVIVAGGMVVVVPTAGKAAPQVYEADYTISFLGLVVAESSFSTTIDGHRIQTKGSLNSAGLGAIFDSTKGTIEMTGRIANQRVVPTLFDLAYTSGKKSQRTVIRWGGNQVADTVNQPPLKERPKEIWIPLPAKQLRNIADPLTAAMVKADDLKAVCDRTIRAYDGEMRANLVLTHKADGTISIPGYSGPTVTCKARFRPVAGYQKNRHALEYLRDKSEVAVTFAPLGQTGLYVPVLATVGTELGTVTIRARRAEAR